MLEEVYGRVASVRHRSEAVEYRVEQHFDWNGGAWVPKPKQVSTRPAGGVQGVPL
jgi:hypothetical protein